MHMNAQYIAPCGLNCRVCGAVCHPNPVPCVGCLGGEGYQYRHCVTCEIVHCEKRASLPDEFCDTCPEYPCEAVREKQSRYTTAYPMYESPVDNLRFLRRYGMAALLAREEAYWRCPSCGGVICVHDGACESCGRSWKKGREGQEEAHGDF